LIARHYFRPCTPEYADPQDMQRFAALRLFTIEEAFGSWRAAHEKHFAQDGVFETLFKGAS